MDANQPAPETGRQYRYAVEAYNLVGTDPRFFRWLLGLDMNRKLLAGAHYGHTTDLVGATIIDEGLPVFSKELFLGPSEGITSPMRALILNRCLGENLTIGSQNLTLLDLFVPQNCATHCLLQCSDLAEAQAGAKLLGLPPERAPELQALKKGEAWVRSVGWEQPVKVCIPLMEKLGAYPSAEFVEQRLEPERRWIREHTVYGQYAQPSSAPIDFVGIAEGKGQGLGAAGTVTSGAPVLLADHHRFLRNIRDHSEDGLKAHYDRLGWGIAKGNAILDDLKSAGLVVIWEVPSQRAGGGRPRKVPRLTPRGHEVLSSV